MQQEKRTGSPLDVVYIALLAILLVVAIFYIGKPRVGMIDLGRVAEELGVEEQIVRDAQQWREEATEDFQRLKDEYRAFGQGISARVAEAETDEEKMLLQKSLADATREYYASSAEVRNRVRQRQQSVLRVFREHLDPFVREVSRKRRLWLVLDHSARLVYATSKIDITDEVIEKAIPFFEAQTNLVESAVSGADVELMGEDAAGWDEAE